MRFWLTFVIVAAALFLGARFAYRQLRPPDPHYRSSSDEAVRILASLPQSCRSATPPQAISKRGEAAQSIDLQGLKLYVPARQAVAHVSKLPQFDSTPELTMRACLADELAFDERVRASDKPGQMTMEQNCVGQLNYHSPKEELELDLVEDLPDQPGCMVVKAISDERPSDLSDSRTEAQLREEFEKKYGRLDNQATLWGENSGAHLMLTRGRTTILLELADTAFAQQKDDARAKIISDADEKAKAAAKHKKTHSAQDR